MEDRTHQIKAEEFAAKEEHAGKLSPAQAARIRAKAKRLLGNRVERIPEFYDEDFPIRFELADGSPVQDLRPRHPQLTVCQYGNQKRRMGPAGLWIAKPAIFCLLFTGTPSAFLGMLWRKV